MTRARARGSAALAALALTMAAGRPARAHGDFDVDRPEPSTDAAGADALPDAARAKHDERTWLTLDLVLGWGRVPFAVQNLPGTGDPTLTYSRSDRTEASVQSLVAAGSTELGRGWGVGFLVPVTFATFSPAGSPSRGTSSFGNVQLEGSASAPLARVLRAQVLQLVSSLGLALPTAQGQEIPVGLLRQNAASVPENAYDRWSLSRAVVFARGYEDNGLFVPQRLGIIPKVGLLYRLHVLRIEPSVKVENLIATSSSLEATYVGQIVGALGVAYAVREPLEVGVRGWVAVGYAGTSDDRTSAAAVEPSVVLRFGSVRSYAGVILPLTGPPSDSGFVGVRLGLTASF
jgi:hypothetical protein